MVLNRRRSGGKGKGVPSVTILRHVCRLRNLFLIVVFSCIVCTLFFFWNTTSTPLEGPSTCLPHLYSSYRPKIFIYPDFLTQGCLQEGSCESFLPYSDNSVFYVNGVKYYHYDPTFYNQGSFTSVELFLTRLIHDCKYITFDPKNADFFLIPTHMQSINGPDPHGWDSGARGVSFRESGTIGEKLVFMSGYIKKGVLKYPYFRKSGGNDHFIVKNKDVTFWWDSFKEVFVNDPFYSNLTYFGYNWWAPDALPNELSPSSFSSDSSNQAVRAVSAVTPEFTKQHIWDKIFGISFPTFYHRQHRDEETPWATSKMRAKSNLVAFCGSTAFMMYEKTLGKTDSQLLYNFLLSTRSSNLRHYILQTCQSSDLCTAMQIERQNGENAFERMISDVIRLYSDSVFCIHPWGDSISRRGVSMSIIHGCIPVLIVTKNMLEGAYRLKEDFYGFPMEDFSIFIDVHTLVKQGGKFAENGGSFVEMLQMKKVRSADEIARIQRNLQDVAQRIHWAHWRSDHAAEFDAFENIVSILRSKIK